MAKIIRHRRYRPSGGHRSSSGSHKQRSPQQPRSGQPKTGRKQGKTTVAKSLSKHSQRRHAGQNRAADIPQHKKMGKTAAHGGGAGSNKKHSSQPGRPKNNPHAGKGGQDPGRKHQHHGNKHPYHRQIGDVVHYDRRHTARYFSKHLRYLRGQHLAPYDIQVVGDHIEFWFRSDRAPSGHWTVSYRPADDGSGGDGGTGSGIPGGGACLPQRLNFIKVVYAVTAHATVTVPPDSLAPFPSSDTTESGGYTIWFIAPTAEMMPTTSAGDRVGYGTFSAAVGSIACENGAIDQGTYQSPGSPDVYFRVRYISPDGDVYEFPQLLLASDTGPMLGTYGVISRVVQSGTATPTYFYGDGSAGAPPLGAVTGAGGAGLPGSSHGWRCDCSDYTAACGPLGRSRWPSEHRDRDWHHRRVYSHVVADHPCKHIYAGRRAWRMAAGDPGGHSGERLYPSPTLRLDWTNPLPQPQRDPQDWNWKQLMQWRKQQFQRRRNQSSDRAMIDRMYQDMFRDMGIADRSLKVNRYLQWNFKQLSQALHQHGLSQDELDQRQERYDRFLEDMPEIQANYIRNQQRRSRGPGPKPHILTRDEIRSHDIQWF